MFQSSTFFLYVSQYGCNRWNSFYKEATIHLSQGTKLLSIYQERRSFFKISWNGEEVNLGSSFVYSCTRFKCFVDVLRAEIILPHLAHYIACFYLKVISSVHQRCKVFNITFASSCIIGLFVFIWLSRPHLYVDE